MKTPSSVCSDIYSLQFGLLIELPSTLTEGCPNGLNCVNQVTSPLSSTLTFTPVTADFFEFEATIVNTADESIHHTEPLHLYMIDKCTEDELDFDITSFESVTAFIYDTTDIVIPTPVSEAFTDSECGDYSWEVYSCVDTGSDCTDYP